MQNIDQIPHDLDEKKLTCKAIIETPKGRRNKFKFLPKSNLFGLSHVLPQGFSFPIDFGFIPSTAADDGDPLDVLVFMDEPAHVGCLLEIRLIGVIKVEQEKQGKRTQNDRLLGVVLQSFAFEHVKSVNDLQQSLLEQVTEFIGLYNKNEDKRDLVQGVEGPDSALKLLRDAAKKFKP